MTRETKEEQFEDDDDDDSVTEAAGNQVLATSPRQNSGSIAAHGLARIRMGGSRGSHHHRCCIHHQRLYYRNRHCHLKFVPILWIYFRSDYVIHGQPVTLHFDQMILISLNTL